MNKTIKWMLAAAVLLGCGIIASPVLGPRAVQAQVQPDQPEQVGRYQLTANNAHVYFLDTSTGQAWRTAVEAPNADTLNQQWLRVNTPVGLQR